MYPDLAGDDFLEFDSLINLRPSHGNPGRGVDNEAIREKVRAIIKQWIKK